jgi:hypothetical protein
MISTISKATGLLLFAISPFAVAQTPPPPGPGAAQTPMHVHGLIVTPKNGQTGDQQWSDRYACDSWSKTQSGFDPAQAPTGVSASELASKRDQYQRAMSACFEGRGYTVTAAAAATAAAAPHAVYVIPASGFRYHPLLVQIEGGYTLTHGNTAESLNGGWNTGLGLTWYPSSTLPVGLRLDANYSRLDATTRSLNAASLALGTNVDLGHQDIYGADLDAEFDFKMSQHVKGYLYGGAGRYRESTSFQQIAYSSGIVCYYYCYPAYIGSAYDVAHNTTGWLNSWNAGAGFEFAMQDPIRFFVEARYQRILGSSSSTMQEFVPIRVGLRF